MGHIVCAIRGGQGSLAVRQLAIHRARERQAPLTFLSIVDTTSLLEPGSKLEAAVHEELRWTVSVLVRIASQHAALEHVKADTAVRDGPVREAIVNFLKEVDADLLLLGAPRGTTANLIGDDAIERFAHALAEETGVTVEVARPEELFT
jgi:nucleotide-binding universal stress UspA family protein